MTLGWCILRKARERRLAVETIIPESASLTPNELNGLEFNIPTWIIHKLNILLA
jgi:hypothetical protein